ncbi:S41 family peptidase [bacterium]|nr:S41 family peptidase [bacterium]
MRKRRIKVIILTVVLVLIVGGGISGKVDERRETYKYIGIFSKVLSLVRSNYVKEVKTKDLIYGALKGMMETLDPYSQFMDPETYKEMQIETEGKFEGLGISIWIRDGQLTVVSPIEGTPAYEIGIQAGDRIVEIDGESTKDITLQDAVKKMRGKKGTSVVLTIEREGIDEPLEFTIVRGVIVVKSIPYSFLTEDKIGYVRIGEFKKSAGKGLEENLEKLEREGMQGLILDLRNNHGGLLNEAVEVCDKFLPKNSLIVSTEGRISSQNLRYLSSEVPHPDYPLVVLINKGSASASEVVAGAIQDYGRGIIIGEKSFGKAKVQSVLTLEDGSGLRLTTAHYLTPKGRNIDEKGIDPDIKVELPTLPKIVSKIASKGYFRAFSQRYLLTHPGVDQKFRVRDKDLDEFSSFLKEKEFDLKETEWSEGLPEIRKQLRIAIIGQALGETVAYQVTRDEDPQFQKAVEMIKEGLSKKALAQAVK